MARPLKFKTPEELQIQIDLYFKETPMADWTITGLALALDTYRQTLLNYEERDEFVDTIKKAKQKVENSYELDLKRSGRSGTIFALKNFDWKDKNETDLTSGGERISYNVISYENHHNSLQLSAEAVSTGIPPSTPEIQDSSAPPPSGEIKDGTQSTDTT